MTAKVMITNNGSVPVMVEGRYLPPGGGGEFPFESELKVTTHVPEAEAQRGPPPVETDGQQANPASAAA